MKHNVPTVDINPDLFEKYFEVPQGVLAYQTFLHQNIRVGRSVLKPKPGNFIVKMRDAFFAITPYVFERRFLKVPKNAVSVHIGFQDKDGNVHIALATEFDNGNGSEHPGSGEGNGPTNGAGPDDAGPDGVSSKLPEQPKPDVRQSK